MRAANSPLSLLRTIGMSLCAIAVLSACADNAANGINTQNGEDPSVAMVAIALSPISREKNIETSGNLIDLQGAWHGWMGEQSTIHYDANTGRLHIAEPENESQISFGVRRFDIPLVAGNWYALRVDAQGSGAVAMIFLVDTNGAISPALTDANGGLMLATDSSPLSFTAPANTAGFYLQVQSGHQTQYPSALSAQIIAGAAHTGRPNADDELITIEHLWPRWDGSPGQVAYVPQSGRLRIEAAGTTGGNAIGAQRLGFGLQAGKPYQLSALQSSDSGASVLLFLFDSQHRVIPFANTTTDVPWLAVSADNPQTFVAPDGVADVGVQVQSAYKSATASYLVPSLRVVTDEETDPALIPVSPPATPVRERPVPTPGQ